MQVLPPRLRVSTRLHQSWCIMYSAGAQPFHETPLTRCRLRRGNRHNGVRCMVFINPETSMHAGTMGHVSYQLLDCMCLSLYTSAYMHVYIGLTMHSVIGLLPSLTSHIAAGCQAVLGCVSVCLLFEAVSACYDCTDGKHARMPSACVCCTLLMYLMRQPCRCGGTLLEL